MEIAASGRISPQTWHSQSGLVGNIGGKFFTPRAISRQCYCRRARCRGPLKSESEISHGLARFSLRHRVQFRKFNNVRLLLLCPRGWPSFDQRRAAPRSRVLPSPDDVTKAPDAARMQASNRCATCGDTEPPDESGVCVRCGASPTAPLPGRGYGTRAIKIIGLVDGSESPFDGEWLMDYDPRSTVHPVGGLSVHLVTTPDPAAALRFENFQAARREWMRWDGTDRIDGKPSRPLTAFTVELCSTD